MVALVEKLMLAIISCSFKLSFDGDFIGLSDFVGEAVVVVTAAAFEVVVVGEVGVVVVGVVVVDTTTGSDICRGIIEVEYSLMARRPA